MKFKEKGKMKFKKTVRGLVLATVLTLGATNMVAFAYSGGNSKCGASSKEVLQIKYDGACWNYKGSGYTYSTFKYVRDNKTLVSRKATNGKATASVWDDLRWGDKYNTKFSWDRK